MKILVLLTEELGEVARELKKTWSPNYDEFDPERLAPEIADMFVLLSALASEMKVNLETAVRDKFFRADQDRDWPPAEA